MSALTTTKGPILMCGEMVRATLRDQNPKTQTRRILNPQPEPPRCIYEPHHAKAVMLGKAKCGKREGTAVGFSWRYNADISDGARVSHICPYGAPGDELFVKETWRTKSQWDGLKPSELPIANEFMVSPFIAYAADGPSRDLHGKTRVSIFMPRWASRITLEIEGVRVERLQDISEEDALAEGVESLDTFREDQDFKICPQCGGTGLYTSFGANMGACFDTDCSECDTHKKRYRHLWESINGKVSWALNPYVWVLTFKRV